ncbi:MAG: hypothetical protein J5517_05315 [Eubacterium sp.]|nr:hypothetical protein [Eubacterium sp.]
MTDISGRLSKLSGSRLQMLEETEAMSELTRDVDAIKQFVPWYESVAGDTSSCEEKKSMIP